MENKKLVLSDLGFECLFLKCLEEESQGTLLPRDGDLYKIIVQMEWV